MTDETQGLARRLTVKHAVGSVSNGLKHQSRTICDVTPPRCGTRPHRLSGREGVAPVVYPWSFEPMPEAEKQESNGLRWAWRTSLARHVEAHTPRYRKSTSQCFKDVGLDHVPSRSAFMKTKLKIVLKGGMPTAATSGRCCRYAGVSEYHCSLALAGALDASAASGSGPCCE